MKTVNFTQQEMSTRIARFKDLKPQSSSYDAEVGIPAEVYETMTARTLYLLMSPENQGGPMAQAPAVVTQDKMSVIIAECPPGDGPPAPRSPVHARDLHVPRRSIQNSVG